MDNLLNAEDGKSNGAAHQSPLFDSGRDVILANVISSVQTRRDGIHDVNRKLQRSRGWRLISAFQSHMILRKY